MFVNKIAQRKLIYLVLSKLLNNFSFSCYQFKFTKIVKSSHAIPVEEFPNNVCVQATNYGQQCVQVKVGS